MRSRLLRLGVLLIPMLALVATMTPPVQAAVAGGGVFVGRLSVANGLAYPCFDGKGGPSGTLPSLNPAKCPPSNAKSRVGFAFSGEVVGALAKAGKAKCAAPACLEAGVFALTAAGVLDAGSKCDLFSGNAEGALVGQALIVDTKPTGAEPLTLRLTGVGGLLVATGSYRGGAFAGVFATMPDSTSGGSCLNKAAKDFNVVGSVVTIASNL